MANVILIIGASSDIGLELIKQSDQDCLIIAHYNSSNHDLLNLMGVAQKKIIPIKADLTNENDLNYMLNEIESKYGVPNKIIHLASANLKNIRFKDLQWKDYEESLCIGLKSLIVTLKKFLPEMAKQRCGKVVVLLSSYVVGAPPKYLSHYIATKYAMLGLVKSLASEFANNNIQINSISPSMIDTKFLKNINKKIIEMHAYTHPLKRNASVKDIIPIIKLLLSKDSDYITGINVPIAGGEQF